MTAREIQEALNAAGYGPLVVDGVLGPKSKAAIRAYQQAHGLAVDGIVGPQTTASLRGGAPAAGTGAQTYRDKYPQFAWAFSDPEVSALLEQGVREGWGPDELQGKIIQTNWWRSKTNAERDWLQTLATNPTEATRQLNNYDSITKYMQQAAAYGIPMDFQNAARQVDRAVRGEVAPDALTEELRIQAKALYPQLAQQIDAGATVDDVFAPYKNIAAQVLGVNPELVQLTDPKWQAALQYVDKNGLRRAATTDEWLRQIKTQAQYGYDRTSQARGEAAQFATQIGEMFGALA